MTSSLPEATGRVPADNRAQAQRPSWLALMAMSLVGIVLALAVGECALRLAGFEFRLAPRVQFGWPDPIALATEYDADPYLFWVTKDYSRSLALARQVHPAVIFMGDSCTEWGTYASKTIAALRANGVPSIEGVKLGVGGWSSEQGRVQAERDVMPLHPRVITVYFGWNDHWVALGPTDRDLMVMRRFLWLADHLRILQVALKARVGASGSIATRPNRVSLERYIDNLETITREARAAGAVVVLITAPSNHVAGHEPAYLQQRHVRKLDEVVPLHRAYVEATRRAAADAGGVLCDAAAAFDALPTPRDRYFRTDGIHLTEVGDQELASILTPCIRQALTLSLSATAR